MIEIVFAFDGLIVLFMVQNFVEGVHREEGDPRHAQLFDDRVGHSRLAARAPAADADQEGFDQLTLSIVPSIRGNKIINFGSIFLGNP